jgi:hypothetical protein
VALLPEYGSQGKPERRGVTGSHKQGAPGFQQAALSLLSARVPASGKRWALGSWAPAPMLHRACPPLGTRHLRCAAVQVKTLWPLQLPRGCSGCSPAAACSWRWSPWRARPWPSPAPSSSWPWCSAAGCLPLTAPARTCSTRCDDPCLLPADASCRLTAGCAVSVACMAWPGAARYRRGQLPPAACRPPSHALRGGARGGPLEWPGLHGRARGSCTHAEVLAPPRKGPDTRNTYRCGCADSCSCGHSRGRGGCEVVRL